MNNTATMYVCRATFEGGVHPGWTSPGKGACAFGWGGLEQDSSNYEIWVEDWEPASNGNVPQNAIVLGYELPPVPSLVTYKRYACQASDPAGGLASGKVAPDLGGCLYPWGGQERFSAYYDVLVDSAKVDPFPNSTVYPVETLDNYNNPTAVYSLELLYNTSYLASSVTSGYEATGQALHLCTASYLNGVHIGKIRDGFGGCDISYGGKEIPNLLPFNMLADNWLSAPGGVRFVNGNFPVTQPIQPNSTIYQGTVIGGNEQNGGNLYICAGWVSGLYPNVLYLPGKLSKAIGGCSVALNGKEYIAPSYVVLANTFESLPVTHVH